MYYCYGQVRTAKGSIAAGTDQSKLWSIFTAGENPVQLIGGSYWSGDAGEMYGLVMLPPSVPNLPNGTATLTGAMGAITLNFQMGGGPNGNYSVSSLARSKDRRQYAADRPSLLVGLCNCL